MSYQVLSFFFIAVLLISNLVDSQSTEVCSGNILGEKNPNGCLIIVKDCIYLYMEKIEINGKIDNNEISETIIPNLTRPEVTPSCDSSSSKSIGYATSSTVTLTFAKGLTNASSVEFDLAIDAMKTNNYWILGNSTVTITTTSNGNKRFPLKSEISAPLTFSYHCSYAKIMSTRLSSDTSGDFVNVYIKRLQVQPFTSKDSKNFFTENYDCAKWFTIATWMGFLAVLLFTIIVATGVYFLSQIRTMDRFENPKAKPISVPTSD